jgi:hypothetical protein
MQVLSTGTLFARGRRTVTAALRQMGLRAVSNFRLYHHVLNRARWSALTLSRRLLVRLVRTVVVGGEVSCRLGRRQRHHTVVAPQQAVPPLQVIRPKAQ